MSDGTFAIALLGYGIVEQVIGLWLRRHYGGAPPTMLRLAFLGQAWLLIVFIVGIDMASRLDQWPPAAWLALLLLTLPAVWYWAKYQIQILPSSPASLPKCPHCDRANPVKLTSCQWCHRPL